MTAGNICGLEVLDRRYSPPSQADCLAAGARARQLWPMDGPRGSIFRPFSAAAAPPAAPRCRWPISRRGCSQPPQLHAALVTASGARGTRAIATVERRTVRRPAFGHLHLRAAPRRGVLGTGRGYKRSQTTRGVSHTGFASRQSCTTVLLCTATCGNRQQTVLAAMFGFGRSKGSSSQGNQGTTQVSTSEPQAGIEEPVGDTSGASTSDGASPAPPASGTVSIAVDQTVIDSKASEPGSDGK
eukprot:scaffold1439_cov404-Prasinococcus_capsulatus_cf.AAC.65